LVSALQTPTTSGKVSISAFSGNCTNKEQISYYMVINNYGNPYEKWLVEK